MDCLGQYCVVVGVLLVVGLMREEVPEDTKGLETPQVCSKGLEITSGLTGWGADKGVLPGNCFLGVFHLHETSILLNYDS